MSSLIDIQSQIEKLQKQATDIKHKEFDKTVQEILAKMHAFGITAKDLQSKSGKARAAKGKAKTSGKRLPTQSKSKSGAVVAAKFRGPNGETWSGRGLTPRWLAALIAQGQTKEAFAVKT
jgi:DNA-binding protein H-NS